MCLYIYLVTDANLPELRWDKRQPAFNVHHLKRKEKFLRNLAGANAYILGSTRGAGVASYWTSWVILKIRPPRIHGGGFVSMSMGSFAAKPALSCLQPGRETRASPPSVPG